MVACFASLFVILPIKNAVGAVKEILLYRVDEQEILPITREAAQIAQELGAEYKLHVTTLGRQVDVECNFLLQDRPFTIAEMDAIRTRLAQAALAVREKHWVNVNFTQRAEEL